MTQPSDNELMLLVKTGDLEPLNILFIRYQGMLTGYFTNQCKNSEIAKDLTQDTFWRLLRYRKTFLPEKPFKAWMFQIARNVYYDHIKNTPNNLTSLLHAEDEMSTQSQHEKEIEQQEHHQLLHKAMNQLSDEKREILTLSRFEKLNYKEIANLLGCTTNNVKIRVYRALNDLKKNYHMLTKEEA